ncbi:C39 family peptidase [Halorhodospira halophila]|uniref:Peptidase C39, bacteriocin processing n=1 Tax=Halorhodospira halophila (strain DSM 244 / SL1) TaxID=349124 RepID=A1WV07_HALHL|nr:C39 family peptidase [Halorhodospira halophila]ABM61519.1 peptidase C39, bacteriocin processing [Halorhodospira halophila SL1]MBK1728768.1 hypothetical protein [Halorhodospira halophila]
MNRHATPLATLGALACLALATPAPAQAAGLPIPHLGGGHHVVVESLQSVRFRGVERQALDYSCGSAAVATLLSYHYDHSVGEPEVFAGMFAAADQQRVRTDGFSMLDMQRYLAELGYRADGFNLTLEQVAALRIPSIVLIDTGGYLHFVVIKGIRDGQVLVGDPAMGLRAYNAETFKQLRRGPLLVIRDRHDLAQLTFNPDRAWAVQTRPPFEHAREHQGLSDFTRNLRRPGDW